MKLTTPKDILTNLSRSDRQRLSTQIEVTPLYSCLFTRLVYVMDDRRDVFPCNPKNLKN